MNCENNVNIMARAIFHDFGGLTATYGIGTEHNTALLILFSKLVSLRAG